MPYDPNKHHRRSIRLRGYDYARPGAYFVTICAHGRQRLFGAAGGGELHLNDAGRMVQRWWAELNHKFPNVTTDAFVVMPDHIHGIIVIGAPGDIDAGGFGDRIADIDAGGYADPPLHDDVDDPVEETNVPNANASVGADLYIRPRRTPTESNDVDDTGAPNANASVGADLYIRPRRTRNESIDANDTRAPNANPSLSNVVQWFKIMTTAEYIRHVKQSGWPPFEQRVWQRGYYERIVRDESELAAARRYIVTNPARHLADLDALLRRMQRKD